MFLTRQTMSNCLLACLCIVSISGCGGDDKKRSQTQAKNLDKEPNSFENPVFITELTNLTGQIGSNSDREDVYVFEATASETFNFTLSRFGTRDLDFYIFDSDGNKIVDGNANVPGIRKLDLLSWYRV